MWWTSGVASAISTCQQRKSVLVVLVEPASQASEQLDQDSETSQQIMSRVATKTMHRVTFADPAVEQLVSDSQSVCLKFPCDNSNPDFNAFSVYFKLSGTAPNLYFISPLTGQTLIQKSGFVSVNTFIHSLVSTTKTVSGRDVSVQQSKQKDNAQSSWKEQLQALLKKESEQQQSIPHAQSTETETPVIQNAHTNPKPTREESQTVHRSTPSKGMTLSKSTPSQQQQSRLLVRLPNGSQVRKSFPPTTKFSAVRAWLSEETQSASNTLLISTAFPRRVFDLGDDPKMLSELSLVPSETLIVTNLDGHEPTAPGSQSRAQGALSAVYGYASGAAGVVTGFFRSFMADSPNANSEEQEQETERPDGHEWTPARHRAPRAMRIRQTEVEDDENLLSNGNSTQYGWNPRDVDEEEGS